MLKRKAVPRQEKPPISPSSLPQSWAHLYGHTLENRLDILGDHVDVGLPLGWWVG